MNRGAEYPGVSNAWTMPIKGRIDMLTTGIRTPVGLKISGADLAEDREDRHADRGGAPPVNGTRSVFAERTGGGLLPRHRMEPRRARALRLEHRGGAERGAERDRRRERDHHGRGTRALSGERPLHARFPLRHSMRSRACWCRRGRAAADPARRAGARCRSRPDPR